MAREVELDQFRSQWKKELGSQNDSLHYPNVALREDKGSGPFEPGEKCGTSLDHAGASKGAVRLGPEAASLLSQVTENVTDVVYEPFVIVGRLLMEGSCPSSLSPKSSSRLNSGPITDTHTDKHTIAAKRSYFDSGSECNSCGGEPRRLDKKKMKMARGKDEGKRRESFIDSLVADLDEINEIPFFEISLARELALKIFQYLDLKDLCSCAQVSKSWQSLSEDNWLWYHVYCQRERNRVQAQALVTPPRPLIEEDSWKSVVKEDLERQKMLINNWKVRLGRVRSLQYVQGGVLSAASYHRDILVAGYSNGQVKLHSLSEDGLVDVCVFHPSDMSLQLDNTAEEGTVPNGITMVDTTDSVTVAVFKHGFVDVWLNEGDLKPCHTIHSRNISSVSITETTSQMLVAVATGPQLIMEAGEKNHRGRGGEDEEEGGGGGGSAFKRLVKVDFNQKISSMKFLPNYETSFTNDCCRLVVATNHVVRIYTAPPPYSNSNNNNTTTLADSENSTEVHNIYGTPITCTEVSGGRQPVLAVGLGSSTALFDGYQVKLYDLTTGKAISTFHGHTWYVSCMHLDNEQKQQQRGAHTSSGVATSVLLSTGCADRKVRLYDAARWNHPVMTLAGHTQKITGVQSDGWKIVSGGEDGVVTVWDVRMATRLWDWHNRHPVRLCRYSDTGRYLVVANIPDEKVMDPDNDDGFADRRHRGSLQVYDFLCDDQQILPDICRSSYDQLHGYDYSINLITPYDNI